MAEDHLDPQCRVTVNQANGEWTVDVCGGLGGSGAKSFVIEEYARNYAAGQRMRLGLGNIERASAGPTSAAPVSGKRNTEGVGEHG